MFTFQTRSFVCLHEMSSLVEQGTASSSKRALNCRNSGQADGELPLVSRLDSPPTKRARNTRIVQDSEDDSDADPAHEIRTRLSDPDLVPSQTRARGRPRIYTEEERIARRRTLNRLYAARSREKSKLSKGGAIQHQVQEDVVNGFQAQAAFSPDADIPGEYEEDDDIRALQSEPDQGHVFIPTRLALYDSDSDDSVLDHNTSIVCKSSQ